MKHSFFASQMKVGFIGLGLMGNPMAKNIKKQGFSLAVFNRSPEKTIELKSLGAKVFNSPKELAQSVDVIITMVTGPDDVKEVLLGPESVVKGGKPGLIAIDMSTIGPKAAKEISAWLGEYKINFLDAPVTGSVIGAETGNLSIFVGGKKEIFEYVKPVLETMGKNIQYMGSSGSGQAIKLVNNIIVAICTTALAEGMLLAESLELTKEQVAKSLDQVPVMSPMMRMKLPNMVNNDFTPAFSMANMEKDLKLALEELKKAQIQLPILNLVEQLFQKGINEGLSNQDTSAILKVLSKSL